MLLQNFVSIGWTVVEILQIFDFQYGGRRHLKYVKYANFNMTHGLQPKSAYIYKISSRPVDRLRIYRHFLISNMAAVRHFEFLKYANFPFLHALQWQSACSCKISSRSVERLRSYCKLNIFNMAAVRHLGFVFRMCGTTHDAALVVRRSPKNFVQIGWIDFEI